MSRPAEQLDAPTDQAAPGERALREAAEWRVCLAEAPVPETDRRAFEQWLRSDAEHVRAWRELEATWDTLETARRPAARAALERTYREERRHIRRLLGRGTGALLLLLALLPGVWLGLGIGAPGHLLADHYTAIGEVRTVDLPDGSRLVLDTGTAVDLQFSAEQRRIRLRDGRLFVDVAPDAERPLEVVTDTARARALGTRFSVRRRPEATRVTVFESRVELCPADAGGDCRRLRRGQRAQASSRDVGPVVAVPTGAEPAWAGGYLAIDDRPVAEVLAELARYHRGVLRYEAAALADLKVSGVLPLDDTGRALDALAASVPIEVKRYTPWVITVSRANP